MRLCRGGNRLRAFETFRNAAVDVFLGKSLGRSDEYRHFVAAGGQRRLEALRVRRQDRIAHAALDVLEKEPPSHNNPMLGMENVTLTAHVASASARFDEARKRRVGYELSLVLSGMWPVSCVNPSVLQNTSLRRWQPVSMDRGPNS